MNNILCVKKNENPEAGLDTDVVMEIFNRSDDMDTIRSAVERAKERLYVTWASVDMVDNAGERIPIQDIIDKQETLLKRNGPVSDMHTNKVVGQTLAYKVLENPNSKTTGVLHLEKVFNDYALDDKVWEEIVSGERAGASVGGTSSGMDIEMDANGKAVKVIEDFEHFETASVYRGCNPLALNEAYSLVAKSAIPGGLAEGKTLKDIADKHGVDLANTEAALAKGIKVEMEHTSDEKVAKEIAMDHLFEDIKYYEKLAEIEKIYTHSSKEGNDQKNKSEGDFMDTEKSDVLKSIETLTNTVKALAEDVAKLKVAKEDVPDEEDMEDEKKGEDIKPEDEEKKCGVKKEDAASDIEGVNTGSSTESEVDPEQNNDADVFKTALNDFMAKVDKKIDAVVKSVETPRANSSDVAKKASNLALDIAKGAKKMSFMDAHMMYRGNKVN